MQQLTTIYSSPCIEPFEELITSIGETFTCILTTLGLPELKASDLFCYGVFCKPETYANFTVNADELPNDVIFPSILTSVCSTADERLDYVKKLIDAILCGEEVEVVVNPITDPCTGEIIEEGSTTYVKQEKPDWMVYVEEETTICGQAPSTFLYLKAKNEDYQELGEKLINFLYSPSKLITMLD